MGGAAEVTCPKNKFLPPDIEGLRGKVNGSSRRRLSDPFRFDLALLESLAGGQDNLRLAGADEAGRGCLAGPLVAAAVVLD